MPDRPARPYRLAALAALPALLAACGGDPLREEVQMRIQHALQARDRAELPAAELTGFAWRQLCFGEDARPQLRFQGAGGERRTALDRGYFIAEAYVAGSPAGRCLGPEARLQLRRRRAGGETAIELRLAAAPAQ